MTPPPSRVYGAFCFAQWGSQAVGDVAKGVDITIDGEKTTAVENGLVWMGLPSVNPKVTVYRPKGWLCHVVGGEDRRRLGKRAEKNSEL